MKIINLLMMIAIFSIGNCQPNYAQNVQQRSDSLKIITVKVKGLTCGNDLKTIATNIENILGVSSCKPGKMGATSSFEIIFNTFKVTEKDIHTAIENTGGCENPNDRPYKVKK